MPYITADCPDCGGEGRTQTLAGRDFWCYTCAGTGQVERHPLDDQLDENQIAFKRCPECGGKGYERCNLDHLHRCPECDGLGVTVLRRGYPVPPDDLTRVEWSDIAEYIADVFADGEW